MGVLHWEGFGRALGGRGVGRALGGRWEGGEGWVWESDL